MNLVWKTKMIGFFRAPWDVRLKNMYASRRKKKQHWKNPSYQITAIQNWKIDTICSQCLRRTVDLMNFSLIIFFFSFYSYLWCRWFDFRMNLR